MPKKLKIRGNNLIYVGKNSDYSKKKLEKIKEFNQKLVPNPINKSLLIKPINIVKKDNTNKGNHKKKSPSCTLKKIFFEPLYSDKKVNTKSLKE